MSSEKFSALPSKEMTIKRAEGGSLVHGDRVSECEKSKHKLALWVGSGFLGGSHSKS